MRLSILGLTLVLGGLAASLIARQSIAASERRSAAARERASDLTILDQRIEFYTARVAREPKGALDLGRLSALYLQRGRQTGSYEDLGRAEAMSRQSYSNRKARNSGAAMVLAQSLLAQHQYLESYDVTSAVAALDSTDLEPRALKAELELELGRYDDAAISFNSLSAQKHQLSVATRYARWLEVRGRDAEAYGMLSAAESLATYQFRMPAEQRAWFHLRVADFALRHGRLSETAAALNRGYDVAPDDYRLEALDARLHAARGDWHGALEAGNRSIAQVLDPATLGLMADAAAALGDSSGSAQYARTMLVAVAAQPGPYHRAAALYLLDHHGDLAEVLKRAEADAAVRHDIYGLDLLAWALHRNHRDSDAMETIERALGTGSRDAQIEFHASQIARSLGLGQKADWLLARAHEDNSALLALTPALAH
jgi:tetratricopeptide (TPR) repeat protein